MTTAAIIISILLLVKFNETIEYQQLLVYDSSFNSVYLRMSSFIKI